METIMSDNVTNELLFETLKAIRTEVADVKSVLKDHTSRFSRIETAIARVGRDQADLYSEQVDDRHTIDALRDRIERIERRLDLTN